MTSQLKTKFNFAWKRPPTHRIRVIDKTSGKKRHSSCFSIHTNKKRDWLRATIIKWFSKQTLLVEEIDYMNDKPKGSSHYILIDPVKKKSGSAITIPLDLPSFTCQEIAVELEKFLCGGRNQ